MLISNGIISRNIDEKQLPEYVSRGYEVVKVTASAPQKPTAKTQKPTTKKGD